MSLVIPAVLPTSREDFEAKLALFSRIPHVSRIQIDVVDGKFASTASWPYSAKATKGTPYLELESMVRKGEMLPRLDKFEYEIDLMCLDAERAATEWLALGATRLVFHAESVTDLPRFLAVARSKFGQFVSLGLALNVASNIALVEKNLSRIDYVQFMGIARIGKQGQPPDRGIFERVRSFHSRHPDVLIQVDGGVSAESARALRVLGVSNVVVGSGLLRAGDPATAFAAFEGAQSQYGV